MFDLLEIRTLGQLHIQWRATDTAVTLAPREAMLLIYLAYHQLPLSRHNLYDLLWPDEPRPRAQGNLRKLLMDIRRTLGDLIVADRHTVTLQDTPRSIWLDVHKFKWHMAPLAQVHRPQQAASIDIPKLIEGVKLYQGDFLIDLKAPRSYLLSAWVEQEQENLRRQMEMALRTLVAYFSGRGQYREAAHYAHQLLQLDPFDEQMVGELMRLWTQVGEREQALTLFRTYRQSLRRETREGPGTALEQLYQTIRGGIVPPMAQAPMAQAPIVQAQSPAFPNAAGPNQPAPRVAAPAGRPIQVGQNAALPKPLTPLLDRDELLSKLQRAVQDPTVRLISLVGMGGMGKSHLALTFANQLVTQASTDVAFVALERFQPAQALVPASPQPESAAPASTNGERTQQLMRAIADVFSPAVALDEFMIGQLLPHLHNRELLLILDYFDPFVAEAALLSDLLQNAAPIKILITARESLQIPGEVVLRLPGLTTALPPTPAPPNHRQWAERRVSASNNAPPSAAAELFIYCIKRRDATVTIQHGDLQYIEQIGHLVEGHPLAIELAAGLVPHYHYAEIVELLTEGIEVLSGTSGQARRHQSIKLLLAESWQRLPDDAQQLLQALTVFADSFSRKAAITVAGASLELLSMLVNRSWLLAQKAGRYRMSRLAHHYISHHTPARQAAELQQQYRARHADYYLSHFLEEIATNHAAAQGKVQFVFMEDGGNVAGAIAWALQYGEPQRQAACRRLLPLLERAQLLQQKHG